MHCKICEIEITEETRARQKYMRCIPCHQKLEKIRHKISHDKHYNTLLTSLNRYECDCGCSVRYEHRFRHFKTNKHLLAMKNKKSPL